MLNVSLDHLREEEVQLILKVLERDAQIQKQEDFRKRRLQNSIRGERIPEKRLSVKLRTGEWLSEMTNPTRAAKKRGSEIVRASIKRKVSTKQISEETTKPKDEIDSISNESVTTPDKPDTETTNQEPERVVENGQPAATIDQTGDIFPYKSADVISIDQPGDISPYKSPFRKTSIRRKKLSTPNDKQVKFDTEKNKNFVYVQTSVGPDHEESQDSPTKDVLEIVIGEEAGASRVEVENIEENQIQASNDSSYETGVYSTSATFKSFHNSFGKEMYKSEERVDENVATIVQSESPEASSPKVVKKIRVVKRKGSTRRKAGPKITDDDSRNTLFNQRDVETQEEDKKMAEQISDMAATLEEESTSKSQNEEPSITEDAEKLVIKINRESTYDPAGEVAVEIVKSVAENTIIVTEEPQEDALVAEPRAAAITGTYDTDESPKVVKKIRVVKRKGSTRRKAGPKITDDDSRNTLFNQRDVETQEEDKKMAEQISDMAATLEEESTSKSQNEEPSITEDAEKLVIKINRESTYDPAGDVAAEIVKSVGENTIIVTEEPQEDALVAEPRAVAIKMTYDTDESAEEVEYKIETEEHHVKELIEATLKPFLPEEPDDNIDDAYTDASKREEDNETAVSGLSEEFMTEYEKLATEVEEKNTIPRDNVVGTIEVEMEAHHAENFVDREHFELIVASETTSPAHEDNPVAVVVETYDPEEPVDDISISADLASHLEEHDIKTYSEDERVYNLEPTETVSIDAEVVASVYEFDTTHDNDQPEVETVISTDIVIGPVSENNPTINDDQIEINTYTVEPEITIVQDEITLIKEDNSDTVESVTVEYTPAYSESIVPSSDVQNEKEESPVKADKPKKKVIKKVIKKKKTTENNEQESPKSEPQQENDPNEESAPNLSRLTRTKTVRKKVIKRKPPPPPTL